MNLQDFINTWTGKYVPSRGGITGQCVSLVQKWAEVNGVGGTPVFPVGAAKDMVGIRGDAFDWIPNTPTGVPQAGDIIVWNTAVGAYGHTAVFVSGNVNSFTSFDQNWPVGSTAHLQSHNYNGVVGWLRFKNKPQEGERNMTPDEERLAYNIVLGRQPEPNVKLGNRTAFQFIKDAEGELTAIRQSSANQIKQLNDRVKELENTLAKANELINKLSNDTTSASLQKKIDELQKRIEELQNSTPTTLDNYSLGELLSAAFQKLFKIK